ncbi:MAG: rRNA maturation RNase YbeY [Pyrinomonadaceae bacterium]
MPFLVALEAGVDELRGKHFAVALVSDKRMNELNEVFRGKEGTTDVLSFPHQPDELESVHHLSASDESKNFLGDIVISMDQALRQAKENKLALDAEIKQLILHGALHLCGYDHETDDGEMNARELELRERLGI